ncbi:MAG TPA: UrcA family protein [Sphingomicrobium sp.]|nr:UrcA family protein [Sphingomicrobium sp.]
MLSRFNHVTAAVLAGVSASIMSPSPAFSQDADIFVRGIPEGAKAERVSYRDLNLRYIAHLNILNDRVERAVRKVCEFRGRDNMEPDYRQCAEASWAGARPQIHRAYLRANRLAAY